VMIKDALDQTVQGHKDRSGGSVLVHSDTLGIHYLIKADPQGPDAYHIASIGKTFTAVLVGRLIDMGSLSLQDKVAPLLAPGSLDGLFVVAGVDYQAEITVDQLLFHTSGIADYFDDEAQGGTHISELIVQEPDHFWSPAELLDFSRNQQAAVGRPGRVFHYSDTGYIVLGLLVEKLYGKPFEKVLEQEIFTPLNMDRTWMPFRSTPAAGTDAPLRAAWLHGTDVSTFTSITADWSGGGIASTEEDLLKFQKALWSEELLSAETLESIQAFDNVFQQGIYYGKGLMQLRFGKFFFLLWSYPRMVGHMGVLATQMFYSPVKDIHIIVSLGSDAAIEDSVRLMIQVLGILLRVK
jgi:D-alanyl-D-alanine carboxypeptidase